LGGGCGIMSVEAVWEEPSLLLSTSIGIVFARVEPTGWLVNFDIGNHCDLVDWSI